MIVAIFVSRHGDACPREGPAVGLDRAMAKKANVQSAEEKTEASRRLDPCNAPWGRGLRP